MRKHNYCSKECHDIAQRASRITKQCTQCGREISIPPSLEKENNFCCNECRLAWLSTNINESLNVPGHSAGHKAPHLTKLNKERNPKLAIEPDAIKRGNYKDHRREMEKILGRKLEPWEDVHHKNGIHDDNAPENLTVMEHSEHLKLHWQIAKEKGVV
jgi:endogenous inhibitor of DNA gyrase (YacG/DUF329 family)